MAIPKFALNEMGWHAFQQLCHTVLREILGQTVNSFLDNRDGGRDGAFVGRWKPAQAITYEGEFVAQCKHSAVPGHRLTLSELSDELGKVERLVKARRCDVYVLMTNASVTGETERKLVAELRRRGVKYVAIFGSTWLNQIIAESSSLRRLVPRLYGLGDLTQILDDRAYRQARSVLDAMRSDLAKFVLTSTYEKAAKALDGHGFVLLLGAPATGKTTIAAQLALGAADDFDTAVIKLESIADLQERWNPDERQLFWLDDAFGATQFDHSRARLWVSAVQRVAGAVHAGGLFVLTSRDYVFRAARDHLKPGSFPLLQESQVVVDVAALSDDERRQILYNHLRHGRQPNLFLSQILPHLELAASHRGFTPELARRLGDPLFTERVTPASASSVAEFFQSPSHFLHDVMSGLDTDARASLGLIFIHHNWLPSPILLSSHADDLLQRLGSTLGRVTSALDSLSGSLVSSVNRGDDVGWVFAHPTMVDAYADLLQTPELLHHLIAGFPLDVLLGEITCGDVGFKGALVVPARHYGAVLDRLEEPYSGNDYDSVWQSRWRRINFLAYRCDRRLLTQWLAREPKRLVALAEPGLRLDSDPNNELVARLCEFGLFPEELRVPFAEKLIDYCVTGEDTAVLWDETLRSILSDAESQQLRITLRRSLLANLPAMIDVREDRWEHTIPKQAPEEAVEPLRDLIRHLPAQFPDDQRIADATRQLEQLVDSWVWSHDWEHREDDEPRRPNLTSKREVRTPAVPIRSIFDDLLTGR